MGQSLERREQDLSILRLMYAVSLRIGDEMQRLSEARLSHVEILALSLINTSPGLSQSDLGTGLNRSPVYVSRMVDELEKADLVERRPHKLDRRRKVLHLSEEGQALFQKMRDRAIELAAEVFRETPAERLKIMSVQSKRIADRLHLVTAGRFVA
ncbi:MarR family winged helix-turn-helix transcriptional regulator [Brevundimonas sp.]|uniref:MarR family winged helix-turn-helix transcriptional regulator n=1 Tax=Brevundimonas sp. TaxID=1871086 RepID=UPI003AF9BB63